MRTKIKKPPWGYPQGVFNYRFKLRLSMRTREEGVTYPHEYYKENKS